MSHPLLKSLLGNLRDLIHDNSEKVRVAFLDLLLVVKGMKAIKVSIILHASNKGNVNTHEINIIVTGFVPRL